MMKFPQPHHISWSKGRRKRLIIGAGVLLVMLAIIGYVLWSKHVWDGYKPAYSSWQHDIRSDISDAIKLPNKTMSQQASVIAAYDEVESNIAATSATTCDVHPLIRWQVVFDELQRRQDDCHKVTAVARSLRVKIKEMMTHLADDRALSQIITTIPQPDELADDAWSSQIDAWGKVAKSAGDLSVGPGYHRTQQVAVERIVAVKNAWQGLAAAHEAKDKQKFIATQATLSAAYDSMNDIAVSSRERTEVLAGELQSAYENFHDKV